MSASVGEPSSPRRPHGSSSAVFIHHGVKIAFSDSSSTSVAVAKMIERLESERDYKVVHDLCGCVNADPEKETRLVDLLASYFESLGRRVELLSWAVSFEVANTDTPNELFRLESVATKLMFRLFFITDQEMFCLRSSVRPLIERISKFFSPSSEPSKTPQPKDFASDVDFILNQSGQLLEELEQSIAFFPIEIREGFVVLAKEVAKKFPETTNVVSVVLFLRFICPSILQAHTFKIVDEPVSPDVLKVLLPIAKLLQSIANEQLENKITTDSAATPKVVQFIQKHIEPVRAFAARLTDEDDLAMLKKVVSGSSSRAGPKVDKSLALTELTSYISSPDFPLPTLQPNESSRSLSAAVRQRKVQNLDDRTIKLDDVLDLVKINLVLLVPDIGTHGEVAARLIDSISAARTELEKLGVKQLLITSGTVTAARDFYEESPFKGDVVVDTSTGSKLLQLFDMRARRQSARSLQDTSPAKNLRRNSEKQLKVGNLKERLEKAKEEKKEKDKKPDDGSKAKSGTVYIIIWNFINFERPIDGSKAEVEIILNQCGASPAALAAVAAKLKRKQKAKEKETDGQKSGLRSFFTLRKRSSSQRS
eukprot:TRINITY_DN1201_c0_g1_i3.p1 TRINITY_DN1201_c0_g1~~TRINITY_DN1201_c0_g1_i3.p1  ORF type:complete len:594 (-),score=90.50 TRINITY_DN1201_c0_g1_i3:1-1782(-)